MDSSSPATSFSGLPGMSCVAIASPPAAALPLFCLAGKGNHRAIGPNQLGQTAPILVGDLWRCFACGQHGNARVLLRLLGGEPERMEPERPRWEPRDEGNSFDQEEKWSRLTSLTQGPDLVGAVNPIDSNRAAHSGSAPRVSPASYTARPPPACPYLRRAKNGVLQHAASGHAQVVEGHGLRGSEVMGNPWLLALDMGGLET